MDEKATQPTLNDVLTRLTETGSGAEKVAKVTAWIKENPKATASDLLLWAEDECHEKRLGRGTVYKIGTMLHGDSYGLRKVGESNSDEIERLRSELNAATKNLDIINRSHGLSAGRLRTLELENRRLKADNVTLQEELDMLRLAVEPRPAPAATKMPELGPVAKKPKLAPRKAKSAAGAMDEVIGRPGLADAEIPPGVVEEVGRL